MKIKFLLFSSLILMSSLDGQVITGFGSNSDFSATSQFGGGDVSGSSFYTISGSDNSALYGTAPSAFIGTPSSLILTATQATNLNSTFQIELFDTNGNGVLYQGSWAFFTQGLSSAVSLGFLSQDFSNTFAFNGNFSSIGLLTTGLGNNTLTVTLDTLSISAIPEPSTYAAILGVMALGFVAWHRRKSHVC